MRFSNHPRPPLHNVDPPSTTFRSRLRARSSLDRFTVSRNRTRIPSSNSSQPEPVEIVTAQRLLHVESTPDMTVPNFSRPLPRRPPSNSAPSPATADSSNLSPEAKAQPNSEGTILHFNSPEIENRKGATPIDSVCRHRSRRVDIDSYNVSGSATYENLTASSSQTHSTSPRNFASWPRSSEGQNINPIDEYNNLAEKYGLVTINPSELEGAASNTQFRSLRPSKSYSEKLGGKVKTIFHGKPREVEATLEGKTIDDLCITGIGQFWLPDAVAVYNHIKLPTVISATATYLLTNRSAPGIFRVSGESKNVSNLRGYYTLQYKNAQNIHRASSSTKLPGHIPYGIHDVAHFFKQTIGGLSGGVLGSPILFKVFSAIKTRFPPNSPTQEINQCRVNLIALTICAIKSPNQKALVYGFLGLATAIGLATEKAPVKHELMDYKALGTVLGPLLQGKKAFDLAVSVPQTAENSSQRRPNSQTPVQSTVGASQGMASGFAHAKQAAEVMTMLIKDWQQVVQQIQRFEGGTYYDGSRGASGQGVSFGSPSAILEIPMNDLKVAQVDMSSDRHARSRSQDRLGRSLSDRNYTSQGSNSSKLQVYRSQPSEERNLASMNPVSRTQEGSARQSNHTGSFRPQSRLESPGEHKSHQPARSVSGVQPPSLNLESMPDNPKPTDRPDMAKAADILKGPDRGSNGDFFWIPDRPLTDKSRPKVRHRHGVGRPPRSTSSILPPVAQNLALPFVPLETSTTQNLTLRASATQVAWSSNTIDLPTLQSQGRSDILHTHATEDEANDDTDTQATLVTNSMDELGNIRSTTYHTGFHPETYVDCIHPPNFTASYLTTEYDQTLSSIYKSAHPTSENKPFGVPGCTVAHLISANEPLETSISAVASPIHNKEPLGTSSCTVSYPVSKTDPPGISSPTFVHLAINIDYPKTSDNVSKYFKPVLKDITNNKSRNIAPDHQDLDDIMMSSNRRSSVKDIARRFNELWRRSRDGASTSVNSSLPPITLNQARAAVTAAEPSSGPAVSKPATVTRIPRPADRSRDRRDERRSPSPIKTTSRAHVYLRPNMPTAPEPSPQVGSFRPPSALAYSNTPEISMSGRSETMGAPSLITPGRRAAPDRTFYDELFRVMVQAELSVWPQVSSLEAAALRSTTPNAAAAPATPPPITYAAIVRTARRFMWEVESNIAAAMDRGDIAILWDQLKRKRSQGCVWTSYGAYLERGLVEGFEGTYLQSKPLDPVELEEAGVDEDWEKADDAWK